MACKCARIRHCAIAGATISILAIAPSIAHAESASWIGWIGDPETGVFLPDGSLQDPAHWWGGVAPSPQASVDFRGLIGLREVAPGVWDEYTWRVYTLTADEDTFYYSAGVTDADVTLDLQGHSLNLVSVGDPNARLCVSSQGYPTIFRIGQGRLSTTQLDIGSYAQTGSSEVVIGAGASVSVQDPGYIAFLQFQPDGAASKLTLKDGGQLSVQGYSFLGQTAGIPQGPIDVVTTGPGTSWDTVRLWSGVNVDEVWGTTYGQPANVHVNLEISDGASVNVAWNVILSWDAAATTDAMVTGSATTLSSLGQIQVARNGSATLLISDGAVVTSGVVDSPTNTSGVIAAMAGSVGSVHLTDFGTRWNGSGSLAVGFGGSGTLLVENSASAVSNGGFIGRNPDSVGHATIQGAGSMWQSLGDILVGLAPDGTPGGSGELTVRDGGLVLVAPWAVRIGAKGILDGDGVVEGNVINGGTVSPGNSPGTLTITGDYIQTSEGRLLIQIGPDGHDLLDVSGNVSLNGTLELVALGGYTPPLGAQFDFLQGTSFSGEFTQVVDNTGLGIVLDFSGGSLRGTVTAVPEPGTMALAVAATGLLWLRRRRT